MTEFCVEEMIVEELKERNFNVDDLLQTHAKKQNKKAVIEYSIDEETITHAKGQYGIDIEAEVISALKAAIKLYNSEGYDVEIVIKEE